MFGPVRTQAGYSELSSDSLTLYKLNNDDNKKQNCLHLTFEYCEKTASIRFARTYFLTPLAKDEQYLQGCNFTDDADLNAPSEQGLKNQQNAQTLFEVYNKLIQVHTKVASLYLTGKVLGSDLAQIALQFINENLKIGHD